MILGFFDFGPAWEKALSALKEVRRFQEGDRRANFLILTQGGVRRNNNTVHPCLVI
jgi:hypothetical protein